ncbi:nuclease [Ancylobacter dichloromethanicus]
MAAQPIRVRWRARWRLHVRRLHVRLSPAAGRAFAMRCGAALCLLFAAGASADTAPKADSDAVPKSVSCPDLASPQGTGEHGMDERETGGHGPLEQALVTTVSPAGDLVLADGTVLRLAGLAGGGAGAEVVWRAWLIRRVAGRDIVFAASGPPDRYGRRPVFARDIAVPGGAAAPVASLQQALLGEGLALARPEASVLGCLPALLEAEASARRARRGLWRRLPLDARNVAAIRAEQGRFTIITGRILDVGKTSRVDYLNFGRVWRQDMTGRIEAPGRIALEARGFAPGDLAGRRVTLRGTVFESGGPAVAIRRAGQLDLDDDVGDDVGGYMGGYMGEGRGRARPTGDE